LETVRSRQSLVLIAGICLLLFGLALVFAVFPFNYRGEMFERHSAPERPDVEIYSKGWVDPSFDAYLAGENGRRELITSALPCRMKLGEYGTNDRRNAYLTNFIAATATKTSSGATLFEVFWTKDLRRVAIGYQDYLVRAHDVDRGQSLGCNTDDVFESRDRCIFLAMQIP
jgi:hypothetical protein